MSDLKKRLGALALAGCMTLSLAACSVPLGDAEVRTGEDGSLVIDGEAIWDETAPDGDAASPETTDPAEDAAGLFDRLSRLGGELLTKTVEQLEAGTAVRTPQDPEQVSYAPMLSKALSPVDWTRPAQAIHDQIRGLIPWPGASTDALTGETVKLWGAQVVEKRTDARPGSVLAAGEQGIDMACGDGLTLRILELQAPGSRRMPAADFLRGHPLEIRN